MHQADPLRDLLKKIAADALSLPARRIAIQPLGPPKDVPDATTVDALVGPWGRRLAVSLLSAPIAPLSVERSMARAKEAKQALGNDLGRVVLAPLAEGTLDGLSYAILPYCPPLSSHRGVAFLQRPFIRNAVLSWLRRVTQQTSVVATSEQLQTRFFAPLAFLRSFSDVPQLALSVVDQALGRLEEGRWQPRVALMHGDLWTGNILLNRRSGAMQRARRWSDFIVIDWPGLVVDGYAFFDLIRFAPGVRLTSNALEHELNWHCELLNCERTDVLGYLAAAHGWIAMHLEHFPRERFLRMLMQCLALASAHASIANLPEGRNRPEGETLS